MSEQNQRPLSQFDRDCIQAFLMWDAMGRPEDPEPVAQALQLPRHTFSNRLLKYFLRDLGRTLPAPILPGHEVRQHTQVLDAEGKVKMTSIKTGLARSDEPFEVPTGHQVKGVSALVDGHGNTIQEWIKTEIIKGNDQAAIIESIRLAAEALAIRAPADEAAEALGRAGFTSAEGQDPDLLNLHPLGDLYLGLYVWGQHCGIAWDLQTAVRVLKDYMVKLIHRAPRAQRGVILVGGDMLHADDETKKTRRSGHVLDVDSRYEKVLSEAEMLMVFQVELALQKYAEVWVRVLPGNHDDDSAVAVTHFLRAWFRNEPRVTVETTPNPHFAHEWGLTMLGACHGHEVKIENLKDVMTADFPEMWGRTRFRHLHGFHWHTSKLGDERGGASWEVHQTPIPRDAYAHNYGFRSGRSMQVQTYSKTRGRTGYSIETL